MNRFEAIQALRTVGERLAERGLTEPVTVAIGGAVAAMVVGDLPASRSTHDCDVVLVEPEEHWVLLQDAARLAALERDLPPVWLNRDTRMYAHLLPLGWRERCERIGAFGPLVALSISRRDLLAMKLAGAPVRPQDLEDIAAMKPTDDEIILLRRHLDRLEAESLAGETFDAQRAILAHLEKP